MKSTWRTGLPVLLFVLALLAAAVGSAATLRPSHPAKHAKSAAVGVPAGFSARVFAAAPAGLTNPDDITQLGHDIFVTFQNDAKADGTPAGSHSTIVEFASNGSVLNQWNLTGRCDGLTADAKSQQVLASINEDANSSLAVIRPDAAPADQIRTLTYSPDPASVSGGGTDALTILDGTIYISASNPSSTSAPAMYRLTVSAQGSTASLQPAFADNAQASQGNAATSGTTALKLTDPDSNAAVPPTSPRFAHDLVLDSQADSQLVFASHPGTPNESLTLLNLGGPQVDDVRWADTKSGQLFVVDQTANQILVIAGAFPAGSAYASVPAGSPMAGTVGRVDLSTGSITPFATGLVSPKGLLYAARNESENEPKHKHGHAERGDS